eukprot:11797399-Alexandrium_andersonii.AAC.1
MPETASPDTQSGNKHNMQEVQQNCVAYTSDTCDGGNGSGDDNNITIMQCQCPWTDTRGRWSEPLQSKCAIHIAGSKMHTWHKQMQVAQMLAATAVQGSAGSTSKC